MASNDWSEKETSWTENSLSNDYSNLNQVLHEHLATINCQEQECVLCSMRDCPSGSDLHYHHDGCPECQNLE